MAKVEGSPSRRGVLAALTAGTVAGAATVGVQVAVAAAAGPDPALAALQVYAEADVAGNRATDALEDAYHCYHDLGGQVPRPEALIYRDDSDHALGLYNFASYNGDSHDRLFTERGVGFLRQHPRRHRHETSRPATVADDFTQEFIDEHDPHILVVRYEPWPESQARADEIVTAWDAWQAEQQRQKDVSGLTAAQQADHDAFRIRRTASAALARTKAITWDGIFAKVALVARIYDGDLDDLVECFGDESTDHAIMASVIRDIATIRGTVA